MIVAAMLLAYTGFTCLCLAMNRHHQQVWRRAPALGISRILRAAGWTLIALSLFACMRRESWTLGLVAWTGALSAAAAALIFLLPYRPRTASALAIIAPLTAVVLVASHLA